MINQIKRAITMKTNSKKKQQNNIKTIKRQDNTMLYEDKTDQELIEYCEAKRREAVASCVLKLKQHILIYLNENINNKWQHQHYQIYLRQFEEDYEIILYNDCNTSKKINFHNNNKSNSRGDTKSCSYEEWIRQCHPENARGFNCTNRTSMKKSIKSSSSSSSNIDKRFYFEKSDHRLMWNECVEMFGYPELIVETRQ